MNKHSDRSQKGSLIPKINHYVVKHGRLTLRQQKPQSSANYRWIPSSQVNKPMPEDYYRQTVKRLETQVKQLMEALRQKQQEWTSRFCEHQQNYPAKNSYNSEVERVKASYEYQIKSVNEKLKIKEQQLWNKETVLRNQYQNKLKSFQQEIRKKDQLISAKEGNFRSDFSRVEQNLILLNQKIRESERKVSQKDYQIISLRNDYENQIKKLNEQIKYQQSVVLSHSRSLSVDNNQKFYLQQELNNVIEQLRRRELEISVKQGQIKAEKEKSQREAEQFFRRIQQLQLVVSMKDNEIRIKDNEIKEKELQINDKNGELDKKDKLIQYQLGVVDRLIKQIQEKEREQMEQQYGENPEQGNKLENYGHRVDSQQRIQQIEVSKFRIGDVESQINPEKVTRSNCQEKQDRVIPLSLKNVDFKSVGTRSRDSMVAQRQIRPSASLGHISYEDDITVKDCEHRSDGKQDLLSSNLNTWNQWATKSNASSFFADFLNQDDSKLPKTNEDQIDPASGALNGLIGKFTSFI